MSHQTTTRPENRRTLIFIFAIILLLSSTVYRLQANDEPPPTPAEVTLAEVIATISDAEQFRYVAQVEQTLIPRAIASNVGKSEERVDAQITAEFIVPDRTTLDLRFEGGGELEGFALEQEGDKTFVIQNGERTQIENPVDSFVPGGDFASYLFGADNVIASAHPDFPDMTILAFDIDSVRIIEEMRANSENANAPLPTAWHNLSGQGELWVRESGYPARQILDLALPEATSEYDIKTHAVIDYQFDGVVVANAVVESGSAERIAQTPGEMAAEVPVSAETTMLAETQIAVPTPDVAQITIVAIVLLVIVASIVLLNPPRWLRVTLPVVLAFILGFTPLLQGISATYAAGNRLPTLAEALDLVPEEGVEDSAETTTPPNPTARQVTENPDACGFGDRTIDTDADGTTDFVEKCLGTNPYRWDTDGDFITDTLEIEGFIYAGQTFYSNPLEMDTNRDGRIDTAEWPQPHGGSDNIDIDGDGIPNLWDEDEDGDGVRDGLDYDPKHATEYNTEFSIQTTRGGSSFNGYQIFDLQVQPKNPDHLRYSAGVLDWPYDDKGQLQDLDNSNDDLFVIPHLKITTPHVPSVAMRELYSVDYEYDVLFGGIDQYTMYLPLNPLSSGGNIVAFNARLAYDPDRIDEIDWQSIELVWTVTMDNDFESTDGVIETYSRVIAEYQDEFRITGIELTTNYDVDLAVLGTPDTPTSDLEAARLMTTLQTSFIDFVETDLDELQRRFNLPEASDETWGLDPDNVVMRRPSTASVPGYYDAAPPVIVETLNAVLNTYTPTEEMVSLIVAGQGQVGSASLNSILFEDDEPLQFNLAHIGQMQMRTLNMVHYTHNGSEWEVIDDDEMGQALADRYGDLEDLAEDLNQLYPDITIGQMGTLLMTFILGWREGSSNIVAIDGVSVLDSSETIDQARIEALEAVGANNMLEYMLRVGDIAEPGAGLRITDRQSYYDFAFQRERLVKNIFTALTFVTKGSLLAWSFRQIPVEEIGGYKVGKRGADQFKSAAYTIRRTKFTDLKWRIDFRRIKGVGKHYFELNDGSAKSVKKLEKSFWARRWASIYKDESVGKSLGQVDADELSPVKLGSFESTKPAKYAKYFANFALAVDIVTTLWAIGELWISYATYHSIYDYEVDAALAYAAFGTLVEVIFFVAGLFAQIALVLAFFWIAVALADLIAWAADSDFRAERKMIEAFAKLHISVHPITTLYDMDYRGLEIEVDDYVTVGSSMTVEDEFTGILSRNRNEPEYIAKSGAMSSLEVRSDNNISYVIDNGESECEEFADGYINESFYENKKVCTNLMRTVLTYEEAGLNQVADVKYTSTWNTWYKQCGGSVFWSSGEGCDRREEVVNLPDDLSEQWGWSELPAVDVLPATITDLWNWSELNNNKSHLGRYSLHDNDADGIIQRYETRRGSDPDLWDTDGDGLSDLFEKEDEVLGSNLLWDTDGDGLNDGLEWRIGTAINDADSDGDGLTDGEEWFHWDGQQWTGGGWYVTIDGVAYWTFAEPISPDLDRDNVGDLTEFSVGIAPLAENLNAPSFVMEVYPGFDSEVFVSAGDTITATIDLYNVGAAIVDDTISFCYPSGFTNIETSISGDSVPTETSDDDCHYWDFSQDSLRYLQTFSAIITATAGTETLTGTISAELPYVYLGEPTTFTHQVDYNQDNTGPVVGITHPISQSILIGDYYVMGGFAEDNETWVDYVKVTVPSGTYTATNTFPWAYQWELPDDGIITVSAVAYDILGNASEPFSTTVTVDSLAPVITSNLPNNATVAAGESYSETVDLAGDVTDNYAGLLRLQVQHNKQQWRTIWSTDEAPLSTTWSGVWQLPALTESAQGEHSMRLRAYDTFGNIGYHDQTVFVDLMPPTAELTNRDFIGDEPNHVPLNEPLAVYGVANDAGRNPLPPGPVELEGTLNSIEDATVWLQPDSHTDDDAGVTMAWIGDHNGDRLADLAIGFPAYANGKGKVVVVNGQAGDWPIPNLDEMEELARHKPSFIGIEGAGIGSHIEPIGDFNGNGFEDFLIGDVANNRIFLMRGSPAAFGLHQTLDDTVSGKWTELLTTVEGEIISAEFSAAGDVNNDSLADILVSATGTTTNTVYLLLGSGQLVGSQILNEVAGATLETTELTSVGHVGDVNGDFIDDYAIAVGNTLHLFLGGVATLDTALASATFALGEQQPTIRAAGDLNNDGIDDFVYSNGATPVVAFGNAGESYTTQILSGYPSALSGFIAAVGDTDKDGLGDLLVGNVDGDAYLLLGGDLNNVAATIEGVASASSTLNTKAADWVGDGSADLAIVPSAEMAGELGYILDQVSLSFVSRSALPSRNSAGANLPAQTTRSRSTGGDVTVGAGDADYTSIQAAIDSGASRVLIEPGIYQESITLASNVTIAGSGPDLTILTLPISDTVLVEANGISNAALLNVTLQGHSGGTGINISNGTSDFDLERTIIQDMAVAIAIDGSTSDLDLKNNTIIGNADGLAATNCATFDVRNTMFVYNTGTALAYEECAAIKRHEFNLYYANGTDMTPNNPGGGELFSDPLFEAYGRSYAVGENSPLINTGSPGDSVPPGAGSRIDIGHVEQTGAGYVASHSYCSTCDNDGLIWDVNAFNTVQGAVDAAEQDMLDLFDSNGTIFTVGVDEGVYNESVEIGWNLQLIGSSPDKTTIQGVGAPAVTLSATVGTKVSGFTLIGGGANPVGVEMTGGSSGLEISHNLFKENTTGLLVNGRSSGWVAYSTFISNTTAIHADEQYNWVDTINNVISGNDTGLLATNNAVIFSDYNLLWNSVDYTNVYTSPNDILADPLLRGDFGYLTVDSPAVDAASLLLPAPTGGGLIADIGWHELTMAPLSVLMGQPDESLATETYGVGAVEYAIVSVADPTSDVADTLPTVWTAATLDKPNEELTYWFTDYTPTATGYYRIYSRATDGLGNTEIDSDDWYDGAFYVDDIAPTVTLAQPELYERAADTWVLLTGVVTDYIGTSFDIDQVYFTVDGERLEARWALDSWEEDGVTGRTFHAVYMNMTHEEQLIDVQAIAVDGAGQIGRSAILTDVFVDDIGPNLNAYVDALPPVITYIVYDDNYQTVFPPFTDLFTGTVEFSVTAYDPLGGPPVAQGIHQSNSGINGFQISFDGGVTWDTLARGEAAGANAPNNYTLPYYADIPNGLDATTIPVKVRVTDFYGNSTIGIATFTVDTAGPRLRSGINLDDGPAIGMHLDNRAPATFSWLMPIDASGTITQLGEFSERGGIFGGGEEGEEGGEPGEITVDPPTVVLNSNVHNTTIRTDFGGQFIASMGARDAAGNLTYIWEGPWYVGLVGDDNLIWKNRGQSIRSTQDGVVDIKAQEYLTPTEWLDDDTRPARTQSLYATWDGQHSYVAWQGADWSTDGTMWVYYDLIDGGTTTPVTRSVTLPFEADMAVATATTDSGWLHTVRYQFNGSSWVQAFEGTGGSAVNTGERGIEFKLNPGGVDNSSLYDNHRMMAYAVNDAGEVWSAFPTSNSLDGAFEDYFDWNITTGSDLLKLPLGAQLPTLAVSITGDPFLANTITNDETITYTVGIVNKGSNTADPVTVHLATDSILSFVSVDGAMCNSCATAQNWLLDVGAIAPNATQQITVVAQLASNVAGATSVTTTLEVFGHGVGMENATLVHEIDIAPPTVSIDTNPGQVIGRGMQAIYGTAVDAGGGLAKVEVSIDGTNWQTATGTTSWEAFVDFQNDTRSTTTTVYARATDMHGLVGNVVTKMLIVDNVAPLITPTVPISPVNGTIFVLAGTASDPDPTDAEVEYIEVRFGDDSAEWTQGTANARSNGTTTQTWSYGWALPNDDYVTHTVRYRATDYGGNTTTTNWYHIVVDNVAPTVIIDTHNTTVEDANPVIAAIGGTVSDGSDSAELRVLLYPETGAETELTPVIDDNGNWKVNLFGYEVGNYTLFVMATDAFGNEWISDRFEVAVIDVMATSIELQQVGTEATNSIISLWFVVIGSVALAWVTLLRLRSTRHKHNAIRFDD